MIGYFWANKVESSIFAGASDDLQDLSRKYLSAALEWFETFGSYTPKDGNSLIERGEAICAALNLYRCLLLKDFGFSKDSKEVNSSGFSQK